jgi:hypothetical protein
MENTKKVNYLFRTVVVLLILIQSCNNRSQIKNPTFLGYDSSGKLRVKIYDLWCKDRDTVYFYEAYDIKEHKNRNLSKVIDSKTFDLLYNFPEDRKKVSNNEYLSDILDIFGGYTPNTFYYFKDRKYIYIYVCGFTEYPCYNRFYIAGRISDYDVLGGAYLRVGNKIYCEGKEVKDADINTFKTFIANRFGSDHDMTLGMDKNSIYVNDKAINSYKEFKDYFENYYVTSNTDSLRKIYFPNEK